MSDLSVIIGKTPKLIDQMYDEIWFYFTDKSYCKFYHDQECCETVAIEDVNGDWSDLIGTPLLVAEERTSEGPEDDDYTSTWTFYTFRSVRGSVDVRWLGTSTGYYSEAVDFWYEEGETE